MVRRRFPVPKTCGFEVSVRFQVAVVQKPSSNIVNSPVLVDNSNDVIFLHCTGSSSQQGDDSVDKQREYAMLRACM
jgi:hypothetical protein